MTASERAFHSLRYLRMNARRLEHLASLGLPVQDKDVLEVGAGIGDLTSFFLDRGCRVTSVEARSENVSVFTTRYGGADFWPADRLRVLQGDAYHLAAHGEVRAHSVLSCFGLLYHLDRPLAALREMAESCTELLILETCVSYARDDTIECLSEDAADLTDPVSGGACLPSRRWIYNRLSELFNYVYVPLTQPAHEQFRLDWRKKAPPAGRSRAVFVASRQPLVNSHLVQQIPDIQYRHLPQLANLSQSPGSGTIALNSIFGPIVAFDNDLATLQILEFGAHTRNELALLQSFVDEGDFVYDVGAHIGTFTLPLAGAVGSSGRVVAIEPVHCNFELLQRNVQSRGWNDSCLTIHAAIANSAGPFITQVAGDNSGATFLLPDPCGEVLNVWRLDDLHQRLADKRPVSVLKIDVEGMELSVLNSAKQLIFQDRPVLYIEIVADQLARCGATVQGIESFLRTYDYCFFRNVGHRNSAVDDFELIQLPNLSAGGAFFDVLAISVRHDKFPRAIAAAERPSPASVRCDG